MKRLLALVTLAGASLVVLAGPASAHPLGNFTVNSYSGLIVHPDSVEVRLVVDMAEIPTFQARSGIDTNHDGRSDDAELAAYRNRQCEGVRRQVDLRIDDQALATTVRSTALSFPPGQAGLSTLRLSCGLTAPADLGRSVNLSYHNANFVDRTGWREITAVGDGVTLAGNGLRERTISAELTRYPKNLLQAPLDERAVTFTSAPGGARLAIAGPGARSPAAPLPRGVDRATKAFTSFVARQHLSFSFAVVAVLLSALLGGIHAFAPGHGKTVMAAYLVGQEGSVRQAGIIALTVTLTHTVGVLVLGVAISASAVVAPERLYPYLGLASGLMLAAIGIGLVGRAWRHRGGSSRHGDDHDHGHHDHDHGLHGADGQAPGHEHEGVHRHPEPAMAAVPAMAMAGAMAGPPAMAGGSDLLAASTPAAAATLAPARGSVGRHTHGGRAHSHGPVGTGQPISWSSMLAIGFVGGFLPSPSAVVVILGAIALHRAWFGVVLVLAYGVGMALTLTGAGLLLIRTKGALDKRYLTAARRDRLLAFNRLMPTLTGSVIIVVGLYLAAQGLVKV